MPASGASIYELHATVAVAAGVWTSRLTKADLGPISNDVFQFAVPSGARRVDSFSAPAGPVERAEEVLAGLLIGSEVENGMSPAGGTSSKASKAARLHARKPRRRKCTPSAGCAARSWCWISGRAGASPARKNWRPFRSYTTSLHRKGVVFLGIDDEKPGNGAEFCQGSRLRVSDAAGLEAKPSMGFTAFAWCRPRW